MISLCFKEAEEKTMKYGCLKGIFSVNDGKLCVICVLKNVEEEVNFFYQNTKDPNFSMLKD